MSLFGAMNTAISGLAAQSAAFGNISDNVANSQTVGFKRVDTSFTDYLTTSSALASDPGTVVARPDYVNSVQGTISQTDSPLALAITGQGFFAVSHPLGTDANGKTVFAPQAYFSRAGDFNLDKSGYLINGSGEYLNGWAADPATGVLDKSNIKTIQVAQTVYKPVATQDLTMGANLPTGYHLGLDAKNTVVVLDGSNTQVQAPTSQVGVYDSQGGLHQLTLTWTPTATTAGANAPWALSIIDTTSTTPVPLMGVGNPAQTRIAAATATTLATDEASLSTAQDTLAQPRLTLDTDQNNLAVLQASLTADLKASTLQPLSTDIQAIQAARVTVAAAHTTLATDKTAAAAVPLLADVAAIDTARQALAGAQATLDSDRFAAPLTPVLADVAAVGAARTTRDAAQLVVDQDVAGGIDPTTNGHQTALDTAVLAVTAAVGTLNTNAAAAEAGTPGVTAAAQALTTDWGAVDTAAGALPALLTTLSTDAAAAEATTPGAIAATQTIVADWAAVDAASATLTPLLSTLATDSAAAEAATPGAMLATRTVVSDWTRIDVAAAGIATDQTAVATAQAGVDAAQTKVNADWTKIEANTMVGAPMVTFGADGTLQSLAYTDPNGNPVNVAANAANANPLAEITFKTPYPTDGGLQAITLNLGSIGTTSGVTQFAGSTFTLRSLTQDGVPPGSFSSISTRASGDIYANYDNGQTRLIARVPVATFSNPDGLQRQNGSSFTVTRESGGPSLQDAGSNGAGSLVIKSVEGSNVDIASEFSKLIVAQRAYAANTKMVTTADELMQQTIDMKR